MPGLQQRPSPSIPPVCGDAGGDVFSNWRDWYAQATGPSRHRPWAQDVYIRHGLRDDPRWYKLRSSLKTRIVRKEARCLEIWLGSHESI